MTPITILYWFSGTATVSEKSEDENGEEDEYEEVCEDKISNIAGSLSCKTFCEALPINIVVTNTFEKIVALVTRFSAAEAGGHANFARNCNKCRPPRSLRLRLINEDDTEKCNFMS